MFVLNRFPRVHAPTHGYYSVSKFEIFRRRPGRSRDGVAVVEFAILLPVLITVVFGTIECCSMIRIRQRLSILAFESARIAVLPESTIEDVRNQCELLCNDDGLVGYDVEVVPAIGETLESGDWITATVTLPLQENTAVGSWFFPSNILTDSVSMQVP